MGSALTAPMEKMQSEMRKSQDKMMLAQQENMARQQRKMMAMQVAMTRERLPWFVGIASFFTLGALGGLVRGKLEPVIAAPLVIVWTITAWQWDLAYYNKANRINQTFNDIMKNEKSFWFVQQEDESNKKK